MRRIDRTTAEDHLTRRARLVIHPSLAKGDAHATLAIQQQARRHSLCLDAQVLAFSGFRQERPCSRAAEAPLAGHLRIADAFLYPAVQIIAELEANLLGRFDETVCQRQDGPIILDTQRAALATVFGIGT